jgi:hypothetical protein
MWLQVGTNVYKAISHLFLDGSPSDLAQFIHPDVLFNVQLSVLRTVLRVVNNSLFCVEIEGNVGMLILHPFLDGFPLDLAQFIRPDVFSNVQLSVLQTVLDLVNNSLFCVEIEGNVGMCILHLFLDGFPSDLAQFIHPDVSFNVL